MQNVCERGWGVIKVVKGSDRMRLCQMKWSVQFSITWAWFHFEFILPLHDVSVGLMVVEEGDLGLFLIFIVCFDDMTCCL